MKNTMPFKVFGNDSDYLTLNINDLIDIEKTIGKSIIKFASELEDGAYTLSDLTRCLPIAYRDCLARRAEKMMTVAECTRKIEEAFETGSSISSIAVPLYLAILETGFFGKNQNAAQRKLIE